MRFVVLSLVIVALAGALVWAVGLSRRLRVIQRLADDAAPIGSAALLERPVADTMLSRWLARAGYRGDHAPAYFVAATVGSAVAGFALGQFYRFVLMRTLVAQVASVPGSAGEALIEVLQAGPILLFVLGALLPMSIVRTRRRARMRAIEQDLPLALEMLATMAEAGLGFDAALSHIVKSRGADRPLGSEFMKFQLDMLAGMPRAQALRQLARRVDVASLTGFTSALVQAEQVGASIAETLQHQATDLRQRRREEALLQSQALPVKLVFPLVICFLPGVFLSTLAPVLYQMLQVANSVLR